MAVISVGMALLLVESVTMGKAAASCHGKIVSFLVAG